LKGHLTMTKDELGTLVMSLQDRIYRVARAVLHHRGDEEEAISEMIVQAFANLDSLREDRYAETWLIRILVRECFKILRQRGRVTCMDDLSYVSQEESVEGQDYSDLYEAVDRLPAEQQLAVTLYYSEGYRTSEIARITEVSENTVKSRLRLAREHLRHDLMEG
jgi:RNA polymerase sigma-70 factor (ECF subfamily)